MLLRLRILSSYFIRRRWRYVAGFLALTIKTLLAVAIPFVLHLAIDSLVESLNQTILFFWAALLLTLASIKGVFQYWVHLLLIGSSRDIEYEFRANLFSHLLYMPRKFFHAYRTSDLISRVTNDVSTLRLMIGTGIMHTASLTMTFFVALILMSATDWKLTCLIFLPISLGSCAVSYFGRQIHERSHEAQKKFSSVRALLQESLVNVRVVQEHTEINQFLELNDEYVHENSKLIRLWGGFYPLLELLWGATCLSVLWYGGKRVVEGNLTLGSFVMFMIYMVMLIRPMIGFGWIMNIWRDGRTSLERLNELLGQFHNFDNLVSADSRLETIRGDLELRNETVRYPGVQQEAIRNLNLEIEAGQSVAIIGPAGCGKSTVANLIPRLIDPSEGMALIDSTDVRSIPIHELRSSLGMVSQEPFLFQRTIRENITFGSPEIEHWKIEKAAQIACLEKDIAEFPHGYNTLVGKCGISLSDGQKQRVAIARALIREPRILILDDAFSNIDTATEKYILEQLRTVMRNCTTVFTSHRTSIAQHASHIIVLVSGKVVDSGTHQDLLAKREHYYTLHQKQLAEQ